jgi:hypothetical protein
MPQLRSLLIAVLLGVSLWPHGPEAQTTDLVAQARQALAADRIDEALGLLEKAVAANPNDPVALAELGSAQVRKAPKVPLFEQPGWVQKGFVTLDRAVERFPDAFVVYVMRGVTAAGVPPMFNKTGVALKDLTTVVGITASGTAAGVRSFIVGPGAGRPRTRASPSASSCSTSTRTTWRLRGSSPISCSCAAWGSS